MWKKRVLIMRNVIAYLGFALSLILATPSVHAQMYYPNSYPQHQYPYGTNQEADAQTWGGPMEQAPNQQQAYGNPAVNLQYDPRDAEMILRDQLSRSRQQQTQPAPTPQPAPSQENMYDNYYGHRIQDEGQVQQVMAEARRVGSLIRNKNGKSFLVIDKRNFQFYLYDQAGRLLRIGPVAIGKGKTDVGAFETPVGVFPIRTKIPVDDWIRPDWYFIEEGEPIPRRWEDRRVPGFFRYKLVFDGSRYVHYAEATGGRLTHGCLGLDWQDAEAVFHTMQVGSYCVIIDHGFLTRLARGEFPIQKPPAKPVKPEEGTVPVPARVEPDRNSVRAGEKALNNLW
ncbi:MAG: L,D-transpeptidase [Desulfomonile tiedjei]|nr:L,D-transpeptidase [Desulfomonile tiedjei]